MTDKLVFKDFKCKKHPLYRGIYKPKVECKDCEKVYAYTQADIKEAREVCS